MDKSYIKISDTINLKEVIENEYSLSSSQYKKLNIKNTNLHSLGSLLHRDLTRDDLGVEIGSDNYIDDTNFFFIKTRALQSRSYLLEKSRLSFQSMNPMAFESMDLKKGDILISKDSNVGEIVILDKDYPNCMLSSAIYRLPILVNKYYLISFIKSELFRQQIDFMVPRGSTIRHGKKKFLQCLIPFPNKDVRKTIEYVELFTKAIINKEIEIQKKYDKIMKMFDMEIKGNQKKKTFKYSLPTRREIMDINRMDSSLYSRYFKEKEFLIKNYKNGTKDIYQLGFNFVRGNNLAESVVGKSIYSDSYNDTFYKLILPKNISKYGVLTKEQYLGNNSNLLKLKKGAIVFGAEGNSKGKSIVIIEDIENTITNFHGLTIYKENQDMQESIFLKLFLDYLRFLGFIDIYATGGNGGSLSIEYWRYIQFPLFETNTKKRFTELYSNGVEYNPSRFIRDGFIDMDTRFNENAGIYEIDKSLKFLKIILDETLDKISNNEKVCFIF
jgi:type I restriction enzyme S subunit